MSQNPKQLELFPDWLVYVLVDPRCGSIFYIGKGMGEMRPRTHVDRARLHMARRPACDGRTAKDRRIISILRRGLDVGIDILHRFGREEDALAFEATWIAAIPGLTNVRVGGSPQWEGLKPRAIEPKRRCNAQSISSYARGAKRGRKITRNDAATIRRRLNRGEQAKRIAQAFSVSEALVSRIKHRKRWA